MCEYCNTRASNKKIEDVDNDEQDFAQVVILSDSAKLYVELDAEDIDGYKASDFFDINYCPMCGEKIYFIIQ